MTNPDITTNDLGLKAKEAGGECACGGHDHAPAEHGTAASSTQAGAAGPIEVGGAGETHGGDRCACGCETRDGGCTCGCATDGACTCGCTTSGQANGSVVAHTECACGCGH